MNGKKAKALRREARRRAAPGVPNRRLVYGGRSGERHENDSRTVRGIYRALKRAVRKLSERNAR